MMQITIDVSHKLGKKLQRFQDRLPEVLERGLQELEHEHVAQFQDEKEIIELLASQPAPKEILAIRPSPQFQARVSHLLAENKLRSLSQQETAELERYLTLEHLVRLAKAYAYHQMSESQ
jgi:hypothetical protein